jgi:tRNA dimethylallyltransferase
MMMKNNNKGQNLDDNPKIYLIYGPTASGKTALALELAHRLQAPIISADSRQIYRWLDIWTWKILPHEQQGIVHYWLDICDPEMSYDAYAFRAYAREITEAHLLQWKSVILCWGTGLYLDAVIFERETSRIPPNSVLRTELEQYRQERGNEALWKRLHLLHAPTADRIQPASYPAVIRAIEILTGWEIPPNQNHADWKLWKPLVAMTPKIPSREILYEGINRRIEAMFKLGLIEEVEWLLRQGYTSEDPGMNSIGYREVVDYLQWNISKASTREIIAQKNRNYAKRQITWNQRYQRFYHEYFP